MSFEAISFEPVTHQYTVEGKIVPSVTKILSFTGLSPDFSVIPPHVLENKRQLGTEVHERTQLIDMGCEVTDDGYSRAYIKFKNEMNFSPTEIELPVYSKSGYAGTIDRVGVINNKLSIVDLKTTQVIDLPYMGPQTAAYEMAYKEWAEYKKVMPRYILQLKPDGNYKLTECKVKEDLNIFRYALEIVKWRGLNNGKH